MRNFPQIYVYVNFHKKMREFGVWVCVYIKILKQNPFAHCIWLVAYVTFCGTWSTIIIVQKYFRAMMQRPLRKEMRENMWLNCVSVLEPIPCHNLQHFHPVNLCSNPTAKSLHCFFTFSSKIPNFALFSVQSSSKLPVFAVLQSNHP